VLPWIFFGYEAVFSAKYQEEDNEDMAKVPGRSTKIPSLLALGEDDESE